jgi:hypothetical protein
MLRNYSFVFYVNRMLMTVWINYTYQGFATQGVVGSGGLRCVNKWFKSD